ncbi:MAG TPA: selenocysteine-specific translation elongation factor [Pyrinomonadaceae bacterium]|nr:selenocysteine-specific translation elongation factor [Pyrinomonadaceae bacterium]
MDIIIGTAGHIDHGKTALVKALTGIDADRLPEEKKRGITIDLGFAELDLGEVRIGFVDVPGHERFVKNMLAGAHGIDLVALVIAADEGVMPQTREHFEICRLLETKTGLVVLTKTDLVDEELLELVKLDASELIQNSFLENAPMIAVSAKTGEGIEELKTSLKNLALKIPSRKNEFVARLPIDRSFTVKGFGAVATGTLIAAEIKVADEMELLPIAKKVRIRGLQTHGKSVENAHAGQRTAVNLGGVEHAEIERGQTLAPVNVLRPTQIFDAEIEVLKDARKPLKSRARVRVHVGTLEALARVQIIGETDEIAQGEKGFAQFRLETPVVVLPNERFIVRSYSPQITIAGGKILDGLANKHRRKDFAEIIVYLQKLAESLKIDDKQNELKLFLERVVESGAHFRDLQARTGWIDSILRNNLQEILQKKSVIDADGIYLSRNIFENLAAKTVKTIQAHHKSEPLSRGMLRETLREKVFTHLPLEIFKKTLQVLVERGEVLAEKDVVRASSYSQNLSLGDKQILEKLQKIYETAKLEVPTLENALAESIIGTKSKPAEARKVFQLLLDSGEIVKISNDFYFSSKAINALVEKLKNHAAKTSDRLIDVPSFKDLAVISRKYAIPLLEYFDQQKITRRAGDKRLIL